MLNQMSYNLEIKIAGKHVTLKRLSKDKYFNYQVKNAPSPASKGQSEHTRENFLKSILRARKRVFDIIACNVNTIPDLHGEIQRPKFWTLTFAENVTDMETANEEFTKFNKRLSWYLYGVRKNVLKYICIPEFQKRGAIHFHILYFNLPYIKQDKFQKIWGKGFTFVKGVSKKEDIMDFASYVAKYINKENSKGEDNYSIYLDKDMLNKKRYFCSRGLNKPEIYKLDIDNELYKSILAMLKDFHSFNGSYAHEFIGSVDIDAYEIEDIRVKESIVSVVNTVFSIMKGAYDRQVKIKFKDVCKYLLPDTFYAIEKVRNKLWKKFQFIEVPVDEIELGKLGWL
ncbi:hypothetical protein R9X47_21720 [Wukongibacter baidiensis]|uniref:rolling circle replication-associated protein n=1 Tax=Wukongibacter baidiensis TaxID=1723361 RepID=UPI003D7FE912